MTQFTLNQVKKIMRANGRSLDLHGTGITIIYDDADRGYELRAVQCGKATWYVAGCRKFASKDSALAHWGSDNYPNKERGQAFCNAINEVTK